MAFVEERVSAEGYFRVRVTGVAQPGWPAGIKERLATRLRECQEAGLPGCMFDVRGLELRMGIMDFYDLGVMLANLAIPGIRVAVLVLPEQILPDRFFQSVASNRGAIVHSFTSEEEAVRWLTVRATVPGSGSVAPAPGRTASPAAPASPAVAPGQKPAAGVPRPAASPPQSDRPAPPSPRPPGRDTL